MDPSLRSEPVERSENYCLNYSQKKKYETIIFTLVIVRLVVSLFIVVTAVCIHRVNAQQAKRHCNYVSMNTKICCIDRGPLDS